MFQKLVSFTKKVADLADRPSINASELKSQFDAAPDEVRQYLNDLIDALKSTKSGDSGAINIGASSITGLTGNNVQSLLNSLKTYSDGKFINATGEHMEVVEVSFSPDGDSNTVTASGTYSKTYTSPPTIMPANVTQVVNYGDAMRYPYIYSITKTGFSVKIGSIGGNFGAATLKMKFMVFGK